MIHFIYKTTHTESGKYYIGRHSTENEQDGYLGSGKWIRSIKDKSKLSREIIGYYNSFDELILAEQKREFSNFYSVGATGRRRHQGEAAAVEN